VLVLTTGLVLLARMLREKTEVKIVPKALIGGEEVI
jgi:hypothetical protein